MKVRFDTLNRFEVPRFYICSPGSVYDNGKLTRVLGCVPDTSDEELVMNFNSMSELNFRAMHIPRDDAEENEYVFKMYKALQNRRMIFVEGVGYFVITSVEDGYSHEDGCFKDIRAESVELEIQNKMLTYIKDGTYKFTDLLEKVVSTIPLWTIGQVDSNVSLKYRTFEDINTELNTLAFMQENMQDAYECIFVFDTIKRQIHVYDQNNYVVPTQIHITKADVINSIEISEDSNDLYTALSVLGDSDLNISPVNPLGTNVIYNFDYYLDWMTDALQGKVKEWSSLVDSKKEEYYNLNLQYYQKMTTRTDLELNIEKLDIQISMYKKCKENIVASNSTSVVKKYNEVIKENGGTTINISENISETLSTISGLISTTESEKVAAKASLDTITGEIDRLKESIAAIHQLVSIKTYFSEEEYGELYNYIFEGSYHDEYISVTDSMTYSEKFDQMKILYDRAVSQLNRAATPLQEFSIDVDNFIFLKEFEQWSNQLETGCLINVELGTNDIALLFLSNITVNYDDKSLSLKFGNRFNKFDPKTLFNNVLGNIKKSTNTLDYIKDIIYPIKNGEIDEMKSALMTSRTLTMNQALSSADEEVVIDGTGYTGRKRLDSGLYDPRQVKINGRNMVFTDDAWETCKTAIGEIILGDNETAYGINAAVILGELIMGKNLRILDSQGNDIFSVIDGKISSSVSDYDEKISQIEQTSNGLFVKITELENKEVTSVKTTTGYTFDSDGLTINVEGEEMKNILNNTGMYVKRNNDYILVANNNGVDAINLTSKQYLIIGENSRFENYTSGGDNKRTGCFYIGG